MASRTSVDNQVLENGSSSSGFTNPSWSSSDSHASSDSSSESFSGLSDQQGLAAIHALISQLSSGGTPEYQAQLADRKKQIDQARALALELTTPKAFIDAKDAMAYSLQQALEKNLPLINRAVQGAGTSASSMQGLLATKLATDSSMAAGALGADQAKAYAQDSVNLQSVLEGLTRPNDSNVQDLIKAIDLLKTSTSSSKSTSQQTSTSRSGGGGGATSASGGGTYLRNPTSSGSSYGVTNPANVANPNYVPLNPDGSAGQGDGSISFTYNGNGGSDSGSSDGGYGDTSSPYDFTNQGSDSFSTDSNDWYTNIGSGSSSFDNNWLDNSGSDFSSEDY